MFGCSTGAAAAGVRRAKSSSNTETIRIRTVSPRDEDAPRRMDAAFGAVDLLDIGPPAPPPRGPGALRQPEPRLRPPGDADVVERREPARLLGRVTAPSEIDGDRRHEEPS